MCVSVYLRGEVADSNWSCFLAKPLMLNGRREVFRVNREQGSQRHNKQLVWHKKGFSLLPRAHY